MIAQFLSKSITAQVAAFKSALKEHGKHVAERNKRVMQYGGSTQTLDSLTSAATTSDQTTTTGFPGSASNSVPSSSSFSSTTNRVVGGDSGGSTKYAMFANKLVPDSRPATVEKQAPLRALQPAEPVANDFVAPMGLHHRSANQSRPTSNSQANASIARWVSQCLPHSFLFSVCSLCQASTLLDRVC